MLNFGASKPRVKGGPGPRPPPLDPHLRSSTFHDHKRVDPLYLVVPDVTWSHGLLRGLKITLLLCGFLFRALLVQKKMFTFVPAVNIFLCAVPKLYSFFLDFSDKNESNLSLASVYMSQLKSFSVKFLSKRGLFGEPLMYETICDCSKTFKGIGMFCGILCRHGV